ncbi:hypothetical protein [Salinifilum ghardaiensis]
MQGYGVHLLFHVLAAACGAGCGVAAALWWHESLAFALVLAVAALVVGLLVLLAQGRYIAAQRSERPAEAAPAGARAEHRPRHGTRPGLPTGAEAPARAAPRTRQDLPAGPTQVSGGTPRTADGASAAEPTRRADERRRGR